MTHILAIDQGTTSSRAIVFDGSLNVQASAQEEFTQHFPDSGWVEHEPEDLWQTTIDTCRAALHKAGLKASDIAAIGITNQRETTLVWDRETGEPGALRQNRHLRRGGLRTSRQACSDRWPAWRGTCCSLRPRSR